MVPLSPATGGYFWQELQRGVLDSAWRAGYQIVMLDPDISVAENASLGFAQFVEGAILGPSTPGDVVELFERHLPTVVINRPTSDLSINIDYVSGTREAVAHLVDLGHRRIAIIAGAGGAESAGQRLRAYRATLAASGIPRDPALERGPVGSVAELLQALKQFLSLNEPPTAFFIAADVLALEAIRFLNRRGLSVPDAASVVGFSDLPLAQMSERPLTTVRVPLQQIGYEAVQMLLGRISGKRDAPMGRLVPTQLVARGTTGRWPSNRKTGDH